MPCCHKAFASYCPSSVIQLSFQVLYFVAIPDKKVAKTGFTLQYTLELHKHRHTRFYSSPSPPSLLKTLVTCKMFIYSQTSSGTAKVTLKLGGHISDSKLGEHSCTLQFHTNSLWFLKYGGTCFSTPPPCSADPWSYFLYRPLRAYFFSVLEATDRGFIRKGGEVWLHIGNAFVIFWDFIYSLVVFLEKACKYLPLLFVKPRTRVRLWVRTAP